MKKSSGCNNDGYGSSVTTEEIPRKAKKTYSIDISSNRRIFMPIPVWNKLHFNQADYVMVEVHGDHVRLFPGEFNKLKNKKQLEPSIRKERTTLMDITLGN